MESLKRAFSPHQQPAPAARRVTLLRTEYNYLMWAQTKSLDRHIPEDSGAKRVRGVVGPAGEQLLRKWRDASRGERFEASLKLDAMAREHRMKAAGIELPPEPGQLILPPGVAR